MKSQTAPVTRGRALIVEDVIDRGLAEDERRLLEAGGYVVSIARDNDEALSMIVSTRPAVVLLDLRLDSIDGLHLLSAIRKTYGPTPAVLAVSGFMSAKVTAEFRRFPNVGQLTQSRLHLLCSTVADLLATGL